MNENQERDYEFESYQLIAGPLEPMAGVLPRILPLTQREHLLALAEVIRRTLRERDAAVEALKLARETLADVDFHFKGLVMPDFCDEALRGAKQTIAAIDAALGK